MPRAVTALALSCALLSPIAAVHAAESDPRAVEIARSVLERMGGEEGWNATRFFRWKFFGGRLHYWDKRTGDVRMEIPERRGDEGELERPELLVLMNINDKRGRVWAEAELVEDPGKLEEYLDQGHQIWINDSYWMFMPYKLLDPGVTLRYLGERALEDGRPADVLDLTFADDAGYTPQNRYEVFVARDTGLVEQWAFFAKASEGQPRFTMPWSGWEPFGRIRLATDHGRGADWDIAVDDQLLRTIFTEQ